MPPKPLARPIHPLRPVLTSGQVAALCGVAPRTASGWCDSGRLPSYRVPPSGRFPDQGPAAGPGNGERKKEGDRRVRREDLVAFAAAYGIPLPPWFVGGGRPAACLVPSAAWAAAGWEVVGEFDLALRVRDGAAPCAAVGTCHGVAAAAALLAKVRALAPGLPLGFAAAEDTPLADSVVADVLGPVPGVELFGWDASPAAVLAALLPAGGKK